jgi:dienelactone hydrolase
MNRRLFLRSTLSLTASAAGLAFAGTAGRSLASPAQSHRILDLELFDVERQRPVPARLYLPGRASPSEPAPLVVFSHGLGGSRRGYSYLGSHWADAGIASLHPQHVGSDNALWRGNPLEMVQRLQSAAREAEAQARVLDLRFALDQILKSDQARLIDPSKIAVAGHSYGANTAMLISGAQVATADGNPVDLRDKRIQAAILISAPPFVGQGPIEQVLEALRIPTLHVTSLGDSINLPGYRSSVEDRITIFNAMNQSTKTLAVFNTGGHSIFTDRITRSGPELSSRIKEATRELCTLFLQRSLVQRIPMTIEDTRQWQARHESLLDRLVMPQMGRLMNSSR